MQLCVNNVQKWILENGLKFSTSQTVCIHCHQQYGFFPDPNIFLEKTPIKVVKQGTFLGLVFDTKLTFKNLVQHLKTSCQKALDILRVVGHTDWGSDRIVLLCLYRSLVRSKLDYGCIVYALVFLSPVSFLSVCVGTSTPTPNPSVLNFLLPPATHLTSTPCINAVHRLHKWPLTHACHAGLYMSDNNFLFCSCIIEY